MNDFRAVMMWLGRMIANALMGGLAFAVVGAFCGGGAALFVELLCGGWGEGVFPGVPVGAFVGVACGVVGIFIHLFSAIGAEPDEFWEPFFNLTARVSFGQLWGTVGACAAFLFLVWMRSLSTHSSFSANANEGALLFAVGAPALMIFGAIAAAVLKRD